MIEKIYKSKYMVVCDNCGEVRELESWEHVLEFMREGEWKKRRLASGKYAHYCADCDSIVA